MYVLDKQCRIEIYHQLRVLLMDNDESTFRVLLQQLISLLDTNKEWFSKYFKEHYYTIAIVWNITMYATKSPTETILQLVCQSTD